MELIAVLGLEVTGAVDARSVGVARELTTALRSRAAEGPYTPAPGGSQELVDAKLLHGCPDESRACMTKVARAIGADHLLYGHVARARGAASIGEYQVSLRLLDVVGGQVKAWDAVVPRADASGAKLAEWARRGYEHLLGGARSVEGRPADRTLVDAANQVFWQITGHKPGQRLDMSDPQDRALSKTWMDVYGQVRGHRDRAAQIARRARDQTGNPYVLVVEGRDGSLTHQEFPSRNHLDVMYTWRHDQPEDYTYLAMFDVARDGTAPIRDAFSLSERQRATASGWYR
jgi:hypothetical protein